MNFRRMVRIVQIMPRRFKVMLRWIWIAPVILLAGCSKEVATTTGAAKTPAGYAQPAALTAPAAAEPGAAQAATLPPAAPENQLPADPAEPVAPRPRAVGLPT